MKVYKETHNGKPCYVAKFESYRETIDYAKGVTARQPNYGKSFTGTSNFDEAYKLAVKGWPEGLKHIDAIVKHLDFAAKIKKPEIVFDVVGAGGFDMGKVLAGEPENCMDWRDSEQDKDSRNGPVIKIIVNCSCSAIVDAETIMARGAAIISLVDALETSGRRVELDSVFFIQGQRHNNYFKVFTPLKSLDHALQEDELAFALAHPSFMRRMMFRSLVACGPEGLQCAESQSIGYPCDDDMSDCDLFIPAVLGYGDGSFENEVSVTNWILRKLEKFGITLEVE